jgi:Family of unknown function (DUF6152)
MVMSRTVPILAVILIMSIVFAVARVGAHHGWSGYDSSQELHLTGTIQEAGYEHPHGYIRLGVPGKVWMVILAPPSRMERRGLTREMLAPGKGATVVGYPHRTDANEMRAERITLDGKTVELR